MTIFSYTKLMDCNLKQSLKNTENQFLIHEKDQKNQIIFLENKINQKVYTHETHKKAEMRFQELELTSNHLKNDLEILKLLRAGMQLILPFTDNYSV